MIQEHKYKVGDRFVIEISSLPMSSDGAYYLTSGKAFYPERVLDNLPQFPNDDNENDLYMLTQEEKAVIEDKAYNKGLEDAWKVFSHVQSGELSYEEIRKVWDMDEVEFVNSFTEKYTPQEALEKLLDWEGRIKEGDICKFGVPDVESDILVTLGSGNPKDNGYVKGIYLNGHNKGNIGQFKLKELRKTDKHFEIDNILGK